MATKKAAKGARRSKSWKDIDQDVKAKSMSSTAFKRRLLARCRRVGYCVAALVAAFFAGKLLLMTEDVSAALTKAGRALPIKVVEVESDALSRDWIMSYLGVDREGLNLLEVNLKALKVQLLELPQVASVDVARRLPDTLFISVVERDPIAKILVEDVERGRVTLLVDREGVVYEGTGYDAKRIKSLPFLDGFSLKRLERGFERVEGMDLVDRLLSEAREIAPHIFQTWKVVSLGELPKLIVKSNFAREIVFEPRAVDYRKQLSELDYIIDYHKSRSYRSIAKVDLTMNSQVPVVPTSLVR